MSPGKKIDLFDLPIRRGSMRVCVCVCVLVCVSLHGHVTQTPIATCVFACACVCAFPSVPTDEGHSPHAGHIHDCRHTCTRAHSSTTPDTSPLTRARTKRPRPLNREFYSPLLYQQRTAQVRTKIRVAFRASRSQRKQAKAMTRRVAALLCFSKHYPKQAVVLLCFSQQAVAV